MTDREALMASILANPDDDLARLVFADWLDETGEEDDVEHAEWIRVSCELKAIPEVAYKSIQGIPGDVASYTAGVCTSCEKSRPERCQRHRLMIRESDLHITIAPKVIRHHKLAGFSSSGMTYRESLRHSPPNVVFFDRGFIHAVACDSASWLDHGGELAKREPVEFVTLTSELPLVITDLENRDEHDIKNREWRFQTRWRVRRADRDFTEEMAMRQVVSEREVMWKGGEYIERFVELFRRECRANATVEGYLKMKWPKVKFTMAGVQPPGPGLNVNDAVTHNGEIWVWVRDHWESRGRDDGRYATFYGRAIRTWEEYQRRGREQIVAGDFRVYTPGMMTTSASFDYESYSQEMRRRMFQSLMIPPTIYNPPITTAASWDDGGGSPIDDLRRAADEIRDQSRGE